MRIAVYGSLRRGGKLYPAMESGGAKFLGESTFPGDLFHLGHYPAAVPGDGTGKVVCEVFECSDALIHRLDSIEGHPWMYKRTEIWIPEFGKCETYYYQRHLRGAPKIENGNYNVEDWK